MFIGICSKCGVEENIYLLDSKPGPNNPDDFETLECIVCYGKDWLPCAIKHLSKSVVPRLRPLYDKWRKEAKG